MIRILLALACLSGLGSQGLRAQTLVADNVYTAPQRLIAIDAARRLNLYCAGQGRPTVILEAGSGNGMITWRHVQAEIARFTRVCAYDRAGLGFSDAASRPSSDANIVDDLYRLIGAADITVPVVFAGHSLGGEVGLLFAAKYPSEVAGAVLVDPGYPDMLRDLQTSLPPAQQSALLDGFRKGLAANRACLALAEAGALTRPTSKAARDCVRSGSGPDKLDDVLRMAIARQLAKPQVWRAMISETESFVPDDAGQSVNEAAFENLRLSFGDKPLIVLTRGNLEGAPGVPKASAAAMEAAWKSAHDGLARLSTRGVSQVVADTGHYIQLDQPVAVIDAVQRVVSELR